jgi:hypothetical protein
MGIGATVGALAVSVAGTFLADWFFGAVLFHEKYLAFPEVWRRPTGGVGEGRAIGMAAAVSLLTPVGFFLAANWLGLAGDPRALGFATGIWLIVPVPLLVTNHLFMKLHPFVTVGHAIGWLVKLMICAAAVIWIAG